MAIKLIYVAHKFGGDLANADKAERITAYLNLHIEGAIFICPWLPMVRHWPDSGDTRALGLTLDIEAVKRCDALIALSPLEGGVLLEWEAAKSKRSLNLTLDPNWDPIDLIQKWVDSLGKF